MIFKLLLNTRVIWMILKKILKNTIQIQKRILLIVFDYMTADMLSNRKLNPIASELFIRGKIINIFLVFVTQPYFAAPKILD